MYCSKCGQQNPDATQFCTSCGQALGAQSLAPQAIPPGTVVPPPLTPSETSGKAIASLICGLLGFIFPAAIAAIILGHISRSEIRKSGGRLIGSGLALTGLILGYLGISFIPFLIIAAITIPNLLRARIAANEASAVSMVRTINVAEVTYASAHPEVGYACSLNDLRETSDSIAKLEGGERYGYAFRIENCTGKAYAITAVPRAVHQTGARAFCSTEDAAIHTNTSGSGQECLEHGEPLR
jgi:type IV pilus assembly protein PilA